MHQHINILLVEDDLVDVMAINNALQQSSHPFLLTVAHDAESALAILRGEQGQLPLAYPYLILLDLNLPKMDGFAFLRELRQDRHLRSSIVFVVTESSVDADRCQAYQEGIAGYLPKANTGKHFQELTTLLDAYCRLVEFSEA